MQSEALANILRSQYSAVFRMLRTALEACPDGLWDRPDGLEAPFWAQALHAIASTRFYLIDTIDGPAMDALCADLSSDLEVEAGRGKPADVPRLRKVIEALTEPDADRRVLSKSALHRHLESAEEAAREILADHALFARPNIMPWSGATLAERLVYNLRHAQHHIGRLHSILGRNGIRVRWVMGGGTSDA